MLNTSTTKDKTISQIVIIINTKITRYKKTFIEILVISFAIFWQLSCFMSRVITNVPGDRGSIPGRVIPKIQKMVLDAALLITQHYKVRIKGKVEQSREWSSALPYTSV